MPSPSKKSRLKPTWCKSSADLAEIIRAMTFEELSNVGSEMNLKIDEDDYTGGFGIARLLNEWAQNK
jgi:hypothetical protein